MLKLRKNLLKITGILIISLATVIFSQQDNKGLPVQLEELTAPDYLKAIEMSEKTCIIPLGILEKHGPHLPLGTDLIDVRNICLKAALQEYTIVFPPYYFGQIYEAKHQPGTFAYSPELITKLLQETCDELGRNGIRKIILVNGHGGNNNWLKYFCQTQLDSPKEYIAYLFQPREDPTISEKIKKLETPGNNGHAGEEETSDMLTHRPDLAHTERAGEQSGKDQDRLDHLERSYTGIWWYAKFPNHYAGNGATASKEMGTLIVEHSVNELVKMIKEVKKDNKAIELQNEFYQKSTNPMKTRQ